MDQVPDSVITSEIGNNLDFKSILEFGFVNKRINHVLCKHFDQARMIKKKLFLSSEEFNKIAFHLYPGFSDILPPIKYRLRPVFSSTCIYVFKRGRVSGQMCSRPLGFDSYNYCRDCSKKQNISGKYSTDIDSSTVFVRYSIRRQDSSSCPPKTSGSDYILFDPDVYTFNSNRTNIGHREGSFCQIFGLKYVVKDSN